MAERVHNSRFRSTEELRAYLSQAFLEEDAVSKLFPDVARVANRRGSNPIKEIQIALRSFFEPVIQEPSLSVAEAMGKERYDLFCHLRHLNYACGRGPTDEQTRQDFFSTRQELVQLCGQDHAGVLLRAMSFDSDA